ncbi:hypothetical protein BZA02_1331 [Ruegeria sp. P4]|nr:hypothetical protein BZA02_1331 [Ruegeria sp. P4]
MLPIKFRHSHTALGLTKHSHNLRLGETALSHSNLLGSRYEKILLPHPFNFREDYPWFFGKYGQSRAICSSVSQKRLLITLPKVWELESRSPANGNQINGSST